MQNQIIQCKACGNGIAKSAKTCPHCGFRNKKPFYTKWWFWLIVVLLVLGAIGSNGDETGAVSNPNESQTLAATTAATTKATTAATTKATTAATTKAASSVSYEEVAELVEVYLTEFEYYETTAIDGGIVVSVAQEGLAEAVVECMNAGYDETYEPWAEMRDNVVYMADTIYEFVKLLVREDCVVAVMVLNDQNHDNLLIGITNGEVTYDILAE